MLPTVTPKLFKDALGSGKIRRSSAILLRVASTQTVVQIVQISAGMWIIRALAKEEYAYYTIANTLLYTIVMLADCGITASLSAMGGKVWQDRNRLGSLLVSGLGLRRDLAVIVSGLLLPVMVWLLIHNGASLRQSLLISAVVGATVVGELTIHTYLIVFRLRSQFNFTQRVALYGSAGRVLWLALWATGRLRVEYALLASSLNTFIQWLWLRRHTSQHADLSAQHDPAIQREMKSVMARQIPLTLYFCLQGQIAIWLASTFGSVNAVSDLGALGRLGALFTVSQAVMQEVVFPGFARAQSSGLVSRRYFQITSAYIAFLVCMVIGLFLFRNEALALLGHQYSRVGPQLPLGMVYCAANALSQVLWGLNYSRAWIQSPVPYIAMTTALQLVLFTVVGASTVNQILWLTILSLVPALVFAVRLSIQKIRVMEEQVAMAAA